MKIIDLDITLIKSYENNPRRISEKAVDKVANSIKEFGWKQPIVVDKDYVIIVGHTRLFAARKLKLSVVPVTIADDLDDAKIKAYRLADNRTNEESEWNFDFLKTEFSDLTEIDFDLSLTGFDDLEISNLLDDDDNAEEEGDIPEVVENPVSCLGDIWILGNHRLMCGDSTIMDNVEKLMNGEKADITFTSPPYNAGKTPSEIKTGKQSKYQNDLDNKNDNDYLQFLIDSTNNSLMFSQYVFFNIQSIAGNKIALIDYLHKLKSFYAETIIWNKLTAPPAMANNVLNSQFEYIHVFSEKANRSIGVKPFRGTLSNIIDISKQTKNTIKNHHATFSVEFASWFVDNFSKNSVIDIFCGSGSTLIACEKTKRKCYGMELSENYCDVIIKRWQNFTGKDAVYEESGKTFNDC